MKVFRIILLLIFGKTARKPIEVGKYYKQVGDFCLYRVTRISKYNEYSAFGRNYRGDWVEDRPFGSIFSPKALWYEISEKEFLEAVKKEIREREYSSSNIIFRELGSTLIDPNVNSWYWSKMFNTLYTMPEGKGGVPIYSEGIFIKKKP